MCGICGIVDYHGPPVSGPLLERMAATLRHRGPDDHGTAPLGPAGLAQTRLSIIDLSPAGHQPMSSPDGRWTLVYNGELYNFPALRRTLEGEGVVFRSRSDTEVVLHALIRRGPECLAGFNGMFALALWDGRERRLLLARDRFGIKPLYWYRLEGGLVFGSEIKALLASERLERRLDWAALHEYLYYGNALGSNTLFAGVRRLPAAHYLTLDGSGLSVRPFWSLEQVRPVACDIETAAEEVRTRLEQAVADHLISDVPVGVFLSGGVDSSAITALASRHCQGRLKTYSVGFDFDRGPNELAKARRVAERFGTEHQELHVSGGNLAAVIERLVRCHDEPFADAANVPLFLLCEQLGGKVKVILQGDGGDEIFAGYRRYNVLAHDLFWRGISRVAAVVGALVPGGAAKQRAMRFFETMNIADPAERLAMLLTVEIRTLPPTRVLSGAAGAEVGRHDPFQRYRELSDRFSRLDVVQRMLYIDSMVLLPDTFLEKVDKSTMAHGIEVRVPFLDANLAEYALGLPSSIKVRNAQKKFILRRALRGIVPDDILDGPKTGFSVPYEFWLRDSLADYMRSVLLDPAVLGSGLFDRPAIENCINEHTSGQRNNGFLLYKLLNLALWQRFYLN
jgi:asparagine synthase (glutamine-hydrolysing)